MKLGVAQILQKAESEGQQNQVSNCFWLLRGFFIAHKLYPGLLSLSFDLSPILGEIRHT